MELKEMAELREFTVQILVHCIEPLLELLLCQRANGVVRRVMVDIWQKYSL
jgi:hypothetical protein